MRHRVRAAAALILTAAVFAGGSAAAVASNSGAQEEAAPSVEEPKTGLYLIARYGDKVGVYLDGELLYTEDIDVSGLRAADRQLLENGIGTDSYEDVLKLMEDLNS